MLLHQQHPQNGKENHSLPGTWPLGVQLLTFHPLDFPCRKMQELLRKEELKTIMRSMRVYLYSGLLTYRNLMGSCDNLGSTPSDIYTFTFSAATKGAYHRHIQCGPTLRRGI